MAPCLPLVKESLTDTFTWVEESIRESSDVAFDLKIEGAWAESAGGGDSGGGGAINLQGRGLAASSDSEWSKADDW